MATSPASGAELGAISLEGDSKASADDGEVAVFVQDAPAKTSSTTRSFDRMARID
jgi:hypothetical protein